MSRLHPSSAAAGTSTVANRRLSSSPIPPYRFSAIFEEYFDEVEEVTPPPEVHLHPRSFRNEWAESMVKEEFDDNYIDTPQMDIKDFQAQQEKPHSHLQVPRPTTRASRRISRFSIALLNLPPVDRGRDAWGYLVGAFIVEALCWGFPLSFGVFQSYLSDNAPFAGSKLIPLIGTLCGGLAYLGTPFSMRIVSRFPQYRTHLMVLGLVLCTSACIAASFAREVWHLIVTQGVMYGIGASFMYVPTLSYMNEWFVARRGIAYGIMFGGTGVSGLLLPILFERLLKATSFATTLRIWGIIVLGLTSPAIYFLIKGRLPISRVPVASSYDLSFFKNRLFLFVAFSNLLQGLGFFIPGIYLPSYATDLSMSSLQATLVLSLLNLTSVFGQVGLGHMADKYGSTMPLFWSTFVGASSVGLLWGFSKTFSALCIFSVIYGLSAGGYSVLLSRFAMEIRPDDSNAQLSMYGIFAFERGIGNIVAGPISAALLGGVQSNTQFAIGKYEAMVIFTAVTMVLSSLSAFGTVANDKPAEKSELSKS